MRHQAENPGIRFVLGMAIWTAVAAGVWLNGPLGSSSWLTAPSAKIVWSKQEESLEEALRGLRRLSDAARAPETQRLMVSIRALSAGEPKLVLANSLAHLSTEVDLDHDLLQEVARTLAAALTEHPVPEEDGKPAPPYVELAQLTHCERVQVSLDSPQFRSALRELEADDQKRQQADFVLSDLAGKPWRLKSLRGKVVLLNFWATWCPPCRKEIPILESLHKQFQDRGLVVLAISDEDASRVKPFIADEEVSYTVLLDPDRKVKTMFHIMRIPKTFVYDRSGKLAGESIDVRTRQQFLRLLAQAGLE